MREDVGLLVLGQLALASTTCRLDAGSSSAMTKLDLTPQTAGVDQCAG